MVPIRKKLGEIIICIYFQNLNRASDKDNYNVPSVEQILELVSIYELFSLLHIFSGYNKVLIAEPNQLNTMFQTKWGMYAYRIIPFGFINARANFQREIYLDFKGLIGESVVVYLNDVTIYSKKREDHPKHLMQIFEWMFSFLGPPKSHPWRSYV